MKNFLFYGFILAFLSCSTDRSNNETSDAGAEEITDMNTAADLNKVTGQDIEQFKSVNADVANQAIEGYLKIKDALVNTNGEEAKRTAKEVQQNISSAEGEGMDIIREDIEQIAGTESVEHQREHFKQLSRNIYALAKASDANKKLYRQYCPMAFDNTGAFWLSSSEEIRNPYFGDRMLKCGKVEESI